MSHIIAAHKYYLMRAKGKGIADFTLSTTGKKTWQFAMLHIYEAVAKSIIEAETSYTFKMLLTELKKIATNNNNNTLAEIAKSLKRKRKHNDNKESDPLLLQELQTVYYSLLFDDSFKTQVDALLDPSCLANKMLLLNNHNRK